MKLSDIHIRDPYILLDGGKYYLYGTRFNGEKGTYPQESEGTDVYVSEDLENFSQPIPIFRRDDSFWGTHHFWAPEVHKYNGRFYMFVTVASKTRNRGVQILVCDTPDGNFTPCAKDAVTPKEWECLDGTLYVENGKPYMVFCHEWSQIGDGEMCLIELSEDLSKAVSEPVTLFKASDPSWATGFTETGDKYVTDGPFFHTNSQGRLLMIWSSIADGKYVEAVSYSENGIKGPWKHYDELLYKEDGGHGMLFESKDGQLMFTMHYPNTNDLERPVIVKVKEQNGTIVIE